MMQAGAARLVALGVAVLAASSPAEAQTRGSVYRVGLIGVTPVPTIMSDPTHPINSGFRREMRDRGYVEGENLVLELRSVEGRMERTHEIVAELVRLKVSVVVTTSMEMTREARRVSAALPIVMAGRDPVEAGFAASLGRPGGNITGLTIDVGEALEAKRLELLREGVPALRKVAYLGSKADWEGPGGRSTRAAAAASGLTLFLAEPSANEYVSAFRLVVKGHAHAVIMSPNARHYTHRGLIAELASRNRLPSIAYSREFVEVGGLMSYGVDLRDLYRRLAIYVDSILKGAKPADLPIEQPTKFELVINMKTARTLGLTIPQSLLLRADQAIQ